MRVFNNWKITHSYTEEIHTYQPEDLNLILEKFYAELQKTNRTDYEPAGLRVMGRLFHCNSSEKWKNQTRSYPWASLSRSNSVSPTSLCTDLSLIFAAQSLTISLQHIKCCISFLGPSVWKLSIFLFHEKFSFTGELFCGCCL